MKKIPVKTLRKIEDLLSTIEDSASEIEDANSEIEDALSILEERFEEREEQIIRYNQTREQVLELVEELTSKMDDYYHDRSDKWLESDKGEAYSEWKEAWACLEDLIPEAEECEGDCSVDEDSYWVDHPEVFDCWPEDRPEVA